jgi:tetratricopeptide (TPR) repeat protein
MRLPLITPVLLAAGLAAAHAPAQTTAEAADRAFQAQDWAAAAKAYAERARSAPPDAQNHFRLGLALHGLGRYDEAARALAEAQKLGSPAPVVQVRLARALSRAGRGDEAVAALEGAVQNGFAALSLLESDAEFATVRASARWPALRTSVDRNLRPCAYAPEYRALDFWVGEWDVITAAVTPGAPAPRSRIELIEDQCVVAEHYTTPAGYTGRSLNVYDLDAKRWEQFYVDNKGGRHHYVGQARDGNVYFEADAVRWGPPGTPAVRVKMTFFNQGKDQVRQFIEQSSDGGRTWTVAFDGTYRRRAPAAAAATP